MSRWPWANASTPAPRGPADPPGGAGLLGDAVWILQDAARWQVVDALLSAPEAQPVLPGPALTECIVAARRSGNTTSPARIAATLSAMGVRVEAPIEADLIRAAQLLELSAQHPGRHARTGERLTLSLAWSQFAEQGHTSAAVVGL